MNVDIDKIKQAIEYLNLANATQQSAGIVTEDDEDVSYEIHNEIENIISVLEEFLE